MGSSIPQTKAPTQQNSGGIVSGETTPVCYTGGNGMNRNLNHFPELEYSVNAKSCQDVSILSLE